MKHAVFIVMSIILLIFSTATFAQTTTKEIKILAVSEGPDGTLSGSVASLKLELVPGTGRIFIETYPLTKIDTQISARIAKEIACKFVDADCRKHDFIYTIRSGGPTIGGPSAGAAISAITIAALDDLYVDKGVTVTGTIGSGGLVGSVGGILQKTQAAIKNDIHTILIPAGERFATNISNIKIIINTTDNNSNISTPQNISKIDLVEYGKANNVDVVEVFSIAQVVTALTGKHYPEFNTSISSPGYYKNTMSNLAEELCSRAKTKKKELSVEIIEIAHKNLNNSENTSTIIARGDDLLNKSNVAYDEERYYASASFCYGAGLQYNSLYWLGNNISDIEYVINSELEKYSNHKLPEIATITDLQTAMLVQERILEAIDYLKQAKEGLDNNRTLTARYNLAYGQERFHSALSWSKFFGLPGNKFSIKSTALKNACALRIQEAQERQQYVQIYIPNPDILTSNDMSEAFTQQNLEEYPLCIFYASKAKAYFDVVINAIGTTEDVLERQFQHRMDIAKQEINRQIKQDIFPIAAFSYVEYAQSLSDSDIFSSLLYVQYGIELSDIEIYLNGDYRNATRIDYRKLILGGSWQLFLFGFSIGMILTVLIIKIDKSLRKTANSEKRIEKIEKSPKKRKQKKK